MKKIFSKALTGLMVIILAFSLAACGGDKNADEATQSVTEKVENALCVPNRALKFTPENNDKKYEKQGIWILTTTGPKRYDIEIGASDDTKTQIISNEIKIGDKVIISKLGENAGKKKSAVPARRPF